MKDLRVNKRLKPFTKVTIVVDEQEVTDSIIRLIRLYPDIIYRYTYVPHKFNLKKLYLGSSSYQELRKQLIEKHPEVIERINRRREAYKNKKK